VCVLPVPGGPYIIVLIIFVGAQRPQCFIY